jgi:hypothetical protein
MISHGCDLTTNTMQKLRKDGNTIRLYAFKPVLIFSKVSAEDCSCILNHRNKCHQQLSDPLLTANFRTSLLHLHSCPPSLASISDLPISSHLRGRVCISLNDTVSVSAGTALHSKISTAGVTQNLHVHEQRSWNRKHSVSLTAGQFVLQSTLYTYYRSSHGPLAGFSVVRSA